MYRCPAVLATALSLSLGAGLAGAQSPEMKDWKVERTDRTVEVPPGSAIQVENPWGQLRVRAGRDGQIQMVANAQRHAEDPREPLIELLEEGEGVVVRVGWTDAEELPSEIPASWQKRRVDLAVLVPKKAALALETRDGLVQLKGPEGDVTVRTESGDVTLRTPGAVDVTNERGSVFLQLLSKSWATGSRVKTKTGEIVANLRNGLNARVEIETSGEITTDYSVEIEQAPHPSKRKTAVAVLGEGGPLMTIESDRGPVKILDLYLLDSPGEVAQEEPGEL